AVAARPPAALADLTCGRLCRAPVAECRTGCTQPTRTAERRCQRDCRDGMVATCKRQMPPRSACLPPDRWQMLGHDLGSNFENLAARTLSPANVGGLELDWRVPGPRAPERRPPGGGGGWFRVWGGSVFPGCTAPPPVPRGA